MSKRNVIGKDAYYAAHTELATYRIVAMSGHKVYGAEDTPEEAFALRDKLSKRGIKSKVVTTRGM